MRFAIPGPTLLQALQALPALVALGLVVLLRPSWLARHLLRPLLPGVIVCGDGRRRELALTIDDGPSPDSPDRSQPGSMALLELLRELQVPATLFVISDHLDRGHPAYLERALADGHGIGHHMREDSVSARLAPAAFGRAFDQAADRIRSAAPDRLVLRWFRPGGGWLRPSMLRSVAARGYRPVLGSVFPWDVYHPPLGWMRWFVLSNVHPGAILVLHDRPDTLPATIALLRLVVPALRARGYRFVSLDRLLST
ncbi:MAG: polysaccharide deacetylase family protein [Cyanobacteriota bacterium]|nr:polysaccharide deacetylase family protein [Cyanobacteriota bacterium]